MNDTIVREIGCHKFPGFYESIFCYADEFVYYEEEVEEVLRDLMNDHTIDVIYEYKNFDKYKYDVCTIFMNAYVSKVIEVLPIHITTNEDFKFNMIDEAGIDVVSPEYYNFSTDKCFCLIETNIKTLEMIKEYVLNKKKQSNTLKIILHHMMDSYLL